MTGNRYKTSANQIIHLGKRLGKGGEGEIYEIREDPTFCAKLYLDPVRSASMEPKIVAMIEIYKKVRATSPQEEYLFDHHLAWPRARLYHPTQGHFVGFVMNRLDLGSCEILGNFLGENQSGAKGWRERLEVAVNLLDMLAFLHSIGVVVGDLHEDNIFVRSDLKVVFIDCDSYQIESRFRCTAMRLEIAPPEALSGAFLGPASDMFEYSILLYRLLMDGFNPFAFRQNPNDKDITFQERKEKGLAPVRKRSLSLPKKSPPLSRIPSPIAKEIAKGLDPQPSKRSLPPDMKDALQSGIDNAKKCPKGHSNPSHLKECMVCGQRLEEPKKRAWGWSFAILVAAFGAFLMATNPHLVQNLPSSIKEWSSQAYSDIERVDWNRYLTVITSKLRQARAKLSSEQDESEMPTTLSPLEALLYLSPGRFTIDRDGISLAVRITKPFYIMKGEVTNAVWDKVMGSSHSCPDCPVTGITWESVQDFIGRLNARKKGFYRLPTEVEWEYAAHHIKGMGSRVWEWCDDWYGESTGPTKDQLVNPGGPGFGSHKVVKGLGKDRMIRMPLKPYCSNSHVGFRLVVEGSS